MIVGLFPNNDFFDDDYEFGKKVHAHRYRPYFVGAYPNYELIYYRSTLETPRNRIQEGVRYLNGLAREFTYTYNIGRYVLGRREGRDPKERGPTSKARTYSGYYDFFAAAVRSHEICDRAHS